jgi:hypothetical protein
MTHKLLLRSVGIKNLPFSNLNNIYVYVNDEKYERFERKEKEIERKAMSEAIEIDSFYTLSEEIKDFVAKLNNLRTRIGLRLRENEEWDSTYQISLIQESLNIRRTVKLLCDDLLNNQLSDPALVSIL